MEQSLHNSYKVYDKKRTKVFLSPPYPYPFVYVGDAIVLELDSFFEHDIHRIYEILISNAAIYAFTEKNENKK